MRNWMTVKLGTTPLWVLVNDVTGNVDVDMGPRHVPTMYRTKKEALTCNTSYRNKLGHTFSWRRVRLTPEST